MHPKDPIRKKNSKVLREVIDEILCERKERTSFPHWNNWNNWMNWMNWNNWSNWFNWWT